MARPKKVIDWASFDELCSLQFGLEEIARFFGCSERTIERACIRHHKQSFVDCYKKRQAKFRITLRRLQWESAMRGDVTMLIWLGKQVLHQANSGRQYNEPQGILHVLAGGVQR